MALVYNNVTLDIDSIQEYTRRPIYHGPNYIYTRHKLRCRCVYNPGATAYILPGAYGAFAAPVRQQLPPGAFAVASTAPWGPLTDINIRHVLMQRRKQLTYTIPDQATAPGAAGRELLVSPARRGDDVNQFYTTDANNGPVPLSCDVVKRLGNKGLVIDFAIQTDLNECHLFKTSPSVMVSNLYKMTRTTDQDFFSTRTIEGEAVFRTDRLLQLGAKPDDFLGYLTFPVPTNMQRASVQTYPSPDGTRCSYRVVDRERPTNLMLGGGNITRVEAYHTFGYNWVGAEGMALATADSIIGIARAPWEVAEMGVPGAGAAVVAAEGLKLADAVAPHCFRGIVVRVWGNRSSRRKDLLTAAFLVATQYANAGQFAVSQQDVQCTEDVLGKFMELKGTLKMGPIASSVQLGISVGAAVWFSDLGKLLPIDGDDIPNVTTSGPFVNPAPPNDNASRGTFVGSLVSQALLSSCETPAGPTDPPAFSSRSP